MHTHASIVRIISIVQWKVVMVCQSLYVSTYIDYYSSPMLPVRVCVCWFINNFIAIWTFSKWFFKGEND